jgi:hypothetical protein
MQYAANLHYFYTAYPQKSHGLFHPSAFPVTIVLIDDACEQSAFFRCIAMSLHA